MVDMLAKIEIYLLMILSIQGEVPEVILCMDGGVTMYGLDESYCDG
jgi:hypothetical protein